VADLLKREGHEVVEFNSGDAPARLVDLVARADAVFHVAGVNRPIDESDFERVNAGLTEDLCQAVQRAGNDPVLVLASSAQALTDSPYGRSKRHGERLIEEFAVGGGRAVVFRLPNVFGPGARPNYNSVVATFAHNAVRGIPLDIHDPSREISLVYVHDVAAAMVDVLEAPPVAGRAEYRDVAPVMRLTLKELAQVFLRFRASRENAAVPDVSGAFERQLYATYLSYLDPQEFDYSLSTRADERGVLAEFLKSEATGQLFISRTRPGAVRGNHYHFTKTEKFFVIEGEGVIRFRRVDGTGEILEYGVKGSDFRVVDIPPDYTHSIENVGAGELIVLFWASEIFDPSAPDTLPLKV